MKNTVKVKQPTLFLRIRKFSGKKVDKMGMCVVIWHLTLCLFSQHWCFVFRQKRKQTCFMLLDTNTATTQRINMHTNVKNFFISCVHTFTIFFIFLFLALFGFFLGHRPAIVNGAVMGFKRWLEAQHYYPGIQFRLPCTPGQFFMGAKLFIGTSWMRNEGVLKKLVWAMWNCMVSMATHSEFEKGGGLPTKLLISQLLHILDN